jgi:hypothetical protein
MARNPFYHVFVIRSLTDQGTEGFCNGKNTKAARSVCPRSVWRVACRKLDLPSTLYCALYPGVVQFYGEDGYVSHDRTRVARCEQDTDACTPIIAIEVKRTPLPPEEGFWPRHLAVASVLNADEDSRPGQC